MAENCSIIWTVHNGPWSRLTMIFKCLKDTSTIQLFERKRLKIGQIFSFDRLKKVLFLIFESFGDINYFIVKLLRIDSIGILGLC